jgi:hypothetical protein
MKCITALWEAVVGLQVCAHTVLVIQQKSCVAKWHLAAMAPGDMIIAASHSEQYLLVRLMSRKAVLLREGSGGHLGTPQVQVVQAASTILNPKQGEALIAACCLYHDTSGWLQSSLQQMESSTSVSAIHVFHTMWLMAYVSALSNEWIDVTAAERRLLAQMEEAHGTFLVTCRSNGSLELYALPELKLVAQFAAVHEGEPTVPAAIPAQMVCTQPFVTDWSRIVTAHWCVTRLQGLHSAWHAGEHNSEGR